LANIKKGFLGELFTGVVAKRLTHVETINAKSSQNAKSNQHEFQGVKLLRSLFGAEDRRQIPTTFCWLEAEQSAVTDEGFITWSNVRKGKPRAAEYHLYYNTNAVTRLMAIGDTAFIALRPGNEALVVIAPANSEMLVQLYWLFGINEAEQLKLVLGSEEDAATFKDFSGEKSTELDFAARFILDEMKIEFELPEADWLDGLLEKYPAELPKTREFAQFARDTCRVEVAPFHDPDGSIMAWLDHEEKLFRRHEHLFIAKRLDQGFLVDEKQDVEGFIRLSKSILQTRMSRMGYSLEHHLAAVFTACGIRFTHGAVTERTSKPDFVFPGIAQYKDATFDGSRLTMLASKSTLKDRWRQATKEADRINLKHIFTLERGISVPQTNEMMHQNVQLVLPRALHSSYQESQRQWLWDLGRFVNLVKQKDAE
jgi:EcoRII C terminal